VSWRTRPGSAPGQSPCSDGAVVIVILQVAIALEQLGSRGNRVWPCRRHRGALEHAPAMGVVRVRKFKTGVISPPQPHHKCYHLACPVPAWSRGWCRVSISRCRPNKRVTL